MTSTDLQRHDRAETRNRWLASITIALLVLLPVLGGRIYGPGWGHPATTSDARIDADSNEPAATNPATATSPEPPTEPSPASDPQAPWHFAAAGEIWAQPVAWHDLVLVGSDEGTVYALDSGTGLVRWTHDSSGSVRHPVATQGESAFWTSADGFVYAADAASGSLRWRTAAGALPGGAAAGNDRVVIGTEEGLVALGQENGRVVWRQHLGAVAATPVLADGLVIAGTRDGRVVAVDAPRGAVRWSFATGAEITTSPTLAGRFVLVAAGDGTIYCLDVARGLERWRSGTSEFVGSAPAVADGRVYVGGGDGALRAFDLRSGLGLWRRRLAQPVRGTPVPAGELLWVAAGERYLAAVRASDGEPRHVFAIEGWVSAAPLVSGERLIFATSDGGVYGLDLQRVTQELAPAPSNANAAERPEYPRVVIEPTFHDGNPKIQWQQSLPARPVAAPAIAAGRVVLGAGRHLYAFAADSGEVLWRDQSDGSFDTTPAIVGPRVLAPRRAGKNGRGAVQAFDLYDGHELWQVATPDDVTSTPAIWRGRAIFGSAEGSVRAVRVEDGGEIWTQPTGGAMLGGAALAGSQGFAVVVAGGCDGVVYGLSADDGRELWRFQTGACVASDIVVQESVGQEVAYVADAEGHVYALDPAVGGELWQASLGGGAGRRPLALGGTLYLGGHDRNVWALSTLHGGTTWKFRAGGQVTGTVVVDLGIAYAASLDGALHAVGAINGQEFWRFETGAPAYNVAFADGIVYVVSAARQGNEDLGAIYALRVP